MAFQIQHILFDRKLTNLQQIRHTTAVIHLLEFLSLYYWICFDTEKHLQTYEYLYWLLCCWSRFYKELTAIDSYLTKMQANIVHESLQWLMK
jgi:hypothetical protein